MKQYWLFIAFVALCVVILAVFFVVGM